MSAAAAIAILRRRRSASCEMLCALALLGGAESACAQRADENVITAASDAFGTTVGNESIGLYNPDMVRGFSPTVANNIRIEGLYADQPSAPLDRISSGSSIRVGIAAQGYAFPAPTGIVDIALRPSGGQTVLSTVLSYGPWGGRSLELDGQVPLADETLSTAIGAARYDNRFSFGTRDQVSAFGIVPRWRPAENIEVVGFFGARAIEGNPLPPIYVPSGNFLPPRFERAFFPGPNGVHARYFGDDAGVLATLLFGDWALRIADVHLVTGSFGNVANLFADVSASGAGEHVLIVDPAARYVSSSGEVRLSHRTSGTLSQQVLASVHWRDVSNRYGGSDVLDLGAQRIDAFSDTPLPAPQFSARDADVVHQRTAGIDYALSWNALADIGVGLQKTDYTLRSDAHDAIAGRVSASPWLPVANAAWHPSATLTLYGSTTRGLEDAGIAPDVAGNRLQPLPAIRTRQWDVGVQWKPNDGARLLIGYFDVSKPYLSLDANNVYRAIGREDHRGIEISQTLTPLPGLTVVAGAVFADPRVTRAAGSSEVIGPRPVGQSRRIAQVETNYEVAATPISIDAGISYFDRQAATVDNAVYAPAYANVQIGARYKLTLAGKPATLRLAITNVTDRFAWTLIAPGAYVPIDRRAVMASFAIDL